MMSGEEAGPRNSSCLWRASLGLQPWARAQVGALGVISQESLATSVLLLFFREDLDKQILDMLFSWAQQNSEDADCVSKLVAAMKESGRQDIADEVETIITLGRQKYRESIQRVGLEQESSTEDSTITMM